jgi:DNA repair protein RadA/Sms
VSVTAPQRLDQIASEAVGRQQTGIAEFDRLLGGGVIAGSLVLIGGEPGIGKCVVGSTRILDPLSGAFLPITEWAHQQRAVLSLDDVSLRLFPQQVAAVCDQGVRPIIEVRTHLGRVLRCTPNHPVLTPDGWQPVGELSQGTRIATPRALPYFGIDAMNEHEVKLIAYALSDGSAANQISVTATILEIETDLAELAQQYHLQLRVYTKWNTRAKQFRFVQPLGRRAHARLEIAMMLKRVQIKSGLTWAAWARAADVGYGMLNAWRRSECVPSATELERLARAAKVTTAALSPAARDRAEMRTTVARFLESVGLRFVKANVKFVPECIFRLPREQLALFLKALFSCDGSVYVNRDGQPGISYSTISRRLAQDVQHLLLRFSFVAKLQTKSIRVNGQPYIAYEIQLLGVRQVKRFLEEIGMWGREEAQACIATLLLPQLPSTQADTIPTGTKFWEHLRDVTGEAPFRRISAKAGVQMHYHRDERPLCRSTVAALADTYPSPYLKALADGEIYWDEIENIAPAGEERVYDLSVPPHSNFVANDLIVHNSTLLLQVAGRLAAGSKTGAPVLYVSGEEAAVQLKLRAERLGISDKLALLILSEQRLEAIRLAVQEQKPAALIVDSVQAILPSELTEGLGTTAQVGEVTFQLNQLAKERQMPIFLIGHITKSGVLAGPKAIEHLVDVVLYLEAGRESDIRILRAVKNRYGSTDEIGVFQMKKSGLEEITNPSQFFTARNGPPQAGSVIVPSLEGTRPILVEVQALVASAGAALPQRRATGLDANRVALLLAVIEKHLELRLGHYDVYLNIAGGLTIKEPALDLGVAAAIVSSLKGRPIAEGTIVVGELGLSGELRRVRKLRERLSEAARLGYRRAIVPVGERKLPPPPETIAVTGLAEAMSALGL